MLVVVLFTILISQGLTTLAWNTYGTGTTLSRRHINDASSSALALWSRAAPNNQHLPPTHDCKVEFHPPRDFRLISLRRTHRVKMRLHYNAFQGKHGRVYRVKTPLEIRDAFAKVPVQDSEIEAARAVGQLYFSTEDIIDNNQWGFFRPQRGQMLWETDAFKQADENPLGAACWHVLLSAADKAANAVEEYYKKYHWLHMDPVPQNFVFGQKLKYAIPIDWGNAYKEEQPKGYDFKEDARWLFGKSGLCHGDPKLYHLHLQMPHHRGHTKS